jgi:hypothetical protein
MWNLLLLLRIFGVFLFVFSSLLFALKTNRWYLTSGLIGCCCGSEDEYKIVCNWEEKYCALALKNLWIPRLATTQTAVILRVQVSAWD